MIIVKKIYTVSLDDDIPLSDKVLNEIKMLCFLIYDEFKIVYFGGDKEILCDEEGLIYNELLEAYSDHEFHYRFKYNDYSSGKYEPFMIDDTSFGFTVNSESITVEEVSKMIDHYKKILDIDYKFTLSSYEYLDNSKKDRLITLKKILSDINSKKQKEDVKDKYIKILKPLVSSVTSALR